jgi:hypothetical protein
MEPKERHGNFARTKRSQRKTSFVMNAIRVLVSQHRAIEALFEELACETRRNARVRAASRLAEDMIAHLAGKEAVFYPAARRALGVKIEENVMLRTQLRRVLATSVHDAAFRPRSEALRLIFEHHVESDETDLFPRVERALGVAELEALGAGLEASRPPVWMVMTEDHPLLRSETPSPQSVMLPAAR